MLMEGVGEDVAGLIVMVLSVFVLFYYIYWNWFRSNSESVVHAESESLASDVRQSRLRNSGLSTAGVSVNQNTVHRTIGDTRCPVCIDDTKFSVQTNCGHIFCGQCIVTWWQTGRWTGAAKCPVCRQQITVLLQCFSEEERHVDSQEKSELIGHLHHYNRRFSGQPLSWQEYIRDLPTLLRHCLSDFFSLGGLLWMFRVRILVCCVAAILYLISPLDIIPEMVFGFFGLLDDFFIVLLLAIYISIIYRRYIVITANAQAPREHAD